MKSSLYILFSLALQQTSYSTSGLTLLRPSRRKPKTLLLLQCGRPSLKKMCDCSGATTESVQVDFGSQGPPPKSQARSEHPASGARRLRATCQTKVKSGDKILYLHNAGAFGELYLPLSPWLLVTCHTNISRRAALRRRSCSLVLQVFARIKRDYVQYISIVLCEVMLWSSSSCMLSCWNMINNLTSSSLQPLFAARMEKYYAMMCYIAPQGSKSLQPVRFC
jgi:hypothetical protein